MAKVAEKFGVQVTISSMQSTALSGISHHNAGHIIHMSSSSASDAAAEADAPRTSSVNRIESTESVSHQSQPDCSDQSVTAPSLPADAAASAPPPPPPSAAGATSSAPRGRYISPEERFSLNLRERIQTLGGAPAGAPSLFAEDDAPVDLSRAQVKQLLEYVRELIDYYADFEDDPPVDDAEVEQTFDELDCGASCLVRVPDLLATARAF